MEENFTLENVVKIIKKRFIVLILSSIIGIGLATVITFFVITPQYKSQAQLIVQSQENTNTNLQSDISANVLLINTYKDMIMGNFVMEKVQEILTTQHNFQISTESLKDSVSVLQTDNSQMFQIIGVSNNAKEAAEIVNTVSEVFKERASEVLNVTKVTIISTGEVSSTPFTPNNKINIVIGFMIGLLFGVLVIFLVEILDKTVKNESFIIEELEFPILGNVSEFHSKMSESDSITIVSENQEATQSKIKNRSEFHRNRKRI